MDKECLNCNHYRAYYVKANFRFDRTNCGLCKLSGETCKKHDEGEKWEPIDWRLQRKERNFALKKLYDLMLEKTAVRQILAEEVDEFKIK